MTVMDLTSHPQERTLLSKPRCSWESLIERVEIAKKRKVADAYLRRFNNRQLRDLGLTRHEVDALAGRLALCCSRGDQPHDGQYGQNASRTSHVILPRR